MSPPPIFRDDVINAVPSPPVFSQQEGQTPLSVPSTGIGSHNDGPPPAYVCDIINDTLNSEEGLCALHAEIKKLGGSAASVEACFKKVARGLKKILLEVAMTNLQKADMQGFTQTWDGHSKTYVRLVWQSRRVAGHARVIAKDFAEDFLSEIRQEKYSIADKKKEIESFRKELEDDRKKSQDLSQDFRDLQSDVVEFQKDFRQYAARVDKLGNEVEELIKEIQKVGVQLTDLTKDSETLLSTFGLEIPVVGTLAVGLICPSLWERLVSGFQRRIEYFNLRQAASNDLDKKHTLAVLEESLKGLKKISALMTSSESDIGFVREKLVIFARIWTFIHADLNEIEKLLDLASQKELQDYFTKKIQTASTVYKTLAHALSLYEKAVHIQEPEVHTVAQFN